MSRGLGATFGSGAADQIATGYTGALLGNRSYLIWVFINGAGGGSLGRVFDKGADVEYLGINGATTSLSWNVSFSTSVGGWSVNSIPGGWQCHVITYNSSSVSNVPTWYINGVAQTVTTLLLPVGTAVSSASAYAIGNRSSNNNRNFDGLLSWFSIWNGVLLNANEVAALAAGAQPWRVRPASLSTCVPMWGLASPEIDLIAANGTAAVTGTKRQNDPPLTLFTPKVTWFVPPTFPVVADGRANAEAIKTSRADAAGWSEMLESIVAISEAAAEAASSAATSLRANAESIGDSVASIGAPMEEVAGGVAGQASAEAESLASARADGAATAEWIGSLVANHALAAEIAGGVRADFASRAESLTSSTSSAAAGLEITGVIVVVAIAVAETLIAAVADAAIAAEEAAAVVLSSGRPAVEATGGVAVSGAPAIEAVAGVSAQSTVAAEFQGTILVAADGRAGIESTTGVSIGIGAVIEAILSARADANANLEAILGIKVVADAAVPIEVLLVSTGGGAAGIESSAAFVAGMAALIDIVGISAQIIVSARTLVSQQGAQTQVATGPAVTTVGAPSSDTAVE